ncbi:MAG: Capsular polysaccharide type 8 biosynthesis protein cap8A [Pelotomaculum sp. PtaB.Bin104]|nr:MAG: Capsular polysaccharide type 8 biosynthesis protein cap8A [Pelotomaculum sp. PtaB.Bin104]
MTNNNQIAPADIDEQEIDLRALLQVLMKHRALIVVLTLLAALVSGLLSFYVLRPVYETKTILLVTQAVDKLQSSTKQEDLTDIVNTISRMPAMTMNTYIGQVKNDELMRRVIEKMNLAEQGYTPRSLAALVNVSAPKDSYLLEVTVSNSDPQLAMDIANTLGREFIDSFTERNRDMMDRSLTFQQEQLEEVKKELALTREQSEKVRLQGMLAQLTQGISQTQIMRSFYLGGTSVVVVSPAIVAAKVKPDKKMNIAIAFLLGLMVSIALAFLLEFMDNTLKTPEDVAQHLGLPVLGVIPAEGSRGGYYGNYYHHKKG